MEDKKYFCISINSGKVCKAVEKTLEKQGFNLEREEPRPNNYRFRILHSAIHGEVNVLDYVRWYATTATYTGSVSPEIRNQIFSVLHNVN
jgi:hypothetical protein